MDLITMMMSALLVKSQPLLTILGVAGSVAAVQLTVLCALALVMIAIVSLGVYFLRKPILPQKSKKPTTKKQNVSPNEPPAKNIGALEQGKNRQHRKAVFQDILKMSNEIETPKSMLIPSITALVPPQSLGSLPKRAGFISVYNEKCITAARNLAHSNLEARALILNNANAYHAGGGCQNGAIAQEEDMMLCSNYYLGLLTIQGQPSTNDSGYYNSSITDALTGSGAIVTKDIIAWLSDYTFEPDVSFQYDAIAMAAPNLGNANKIPSFLKQSDNHVNYIAYTTHMKTMIRAQIYAAINHQYTVFLPGAIGCGVFKSFEEGNEVEVGHTATIVAKIYKELLVDEGLAQYFDHVYFPIFNGNKPDPQTSNIAIFQKAFGLTPALALHTGSTQSYAVLAGKEAKPECKGANKLKKG